MPILGIVSTGLQVVRSTYRLVRLGIRRRDLSLRLAVGDDDARSLQAVEATELVKSTLIKRMNRVGAIAGMITGLIVTLLYVFQHKGIMFIQSTSFLGPLEPNWFFGIEPNAFGAVGAMVNFAVAITVARFFRAPPEAVQLLVEHIRVPGDLGSHLASPAQRGAD